MARDLFLPVAEGVGVGVVVVGAGVVAGVGLDTALEVRLRLSPPPPPTAPPETSMALPAWSSLLSAALSAALPTEVELMMTALANRT